MKTFTLRFSRVLYDSDNFEIHIRDRNQWGLDIHANFVDLDLRSRSRLEVKVKVVVVFSGYVWREGGWMGVIVIDLDKLWCCVRLGDLDQRSRSPWPEKLFWQKNLNVGIFSGTMTAEAFKLISKIKFFEGSTFILISVTLTEGQGHGKVSHIRVVVLLYIWKLLSHFKSFFH